MSSLRARVVIGTLLWTIGIVVVVHFLSISLFHRFRTMAVVHFALLGVLIVGLIAAGMWQVRSGLASLTQLRTRLATLRSGHARRVEGDYPSEVQPLVDDLNALLDDRERRVTRAQSKAGDLAHGLKTPLAVLAQEAERAGAAGQTELATVMGEQVERMRRQIESHLAQARADASGASPEARARVDDSAQALARTLMRLHAERGVAIDVQVPASLVVRVAREELDEMLGNLIDNACKWARSRVTISAAGAEGAITILVDDDGPGLAPAMRESVLRRGVRGDETAPGSGLGLGIVRDVADLHGGSIALIGSPLGGLRARLVLPAG